MTKLFKVSLLKTCKNNYSLIPMVFIGVVGFGLATAASVRTLMSSPDITINKKKHELPFEKLLRPDGSSVQYKLYTTIDYNKLKMDPEKPKI
jgi:hypothetical protein